MPRQVICTTFFVSCLFVRVNFFLGLGTETGKETAVSFGSRKQTNNKCKIALTGSGFLINGAASSYILAKEVSTMDRIISIEKDMIKILNMLFCLDSALLAFLFGVFFFCITRPL